MSTGQVVLLAYGALLLFGGWFGFRKAGSKPSLVSGIASAAVLACAFFVTMYGTPEHGYRAGAVYSFLMCILFGSRLAKTRKFMPSGMLVIVSAVALVLLAVSGWGAGGA